MSALLSIVTTTRPARLSKGFELNPDGSVAKYPGGRLVRGRVRRAQVTGPATLAELIRGLTPDSALCFGVPERDGEIVPKAELARHSGAIARTRQHFNWPEGPGVLLLDYDPAEGAPPLAFADLLLLLTQAMPELAQAPLVAVPSASSCISKIDGTEVRGIRGWHVFLIVETASNIPAIGETIAARLWLAGHGRVQVSKSGALLTRTLVDTTVWQPERLSFDGGAECGQGLTQDRLAHLVVRNDGAAPMPTPKPLNQKESSAYRKTVSEAKTQARPAAEEARAVWVEERLGDVLNATPGADESAARRTLERAVMHLELMGDFELVAQDGTRVRVSDLLDDQARWDGRRFHDPLEPDYRGDNRIAVARLIGSRPHIFSHAHGGRTYRLIHQPLTLELVDGSYPDHARTIAERLGAAQMVFDMGGALVSVHDGKPHVLHTAGIAHLTEQLFAFEKYDARMGKKKLVQLPQDLAQRLLECRDTWTAYPRLTAIVEHPVFTPTGHLLMDGYDEETGLLIASGREWHIPDNPTNAQLRAAIETLWKPLSAMPWETSADAGAALALLLTAAVRPALDLAPLFMTTAPSYGAGKTLIAQVAAIIAGGEGSVTAIGSDEDEMRKTIVALLLDGAPAVILDNLTGELKGDALAALMTGPIFRCCILGKSETVTLPNRSLWLASGVNFRPGADMVRRTISVRIDPATEHLEDRPFTFDPVALARETRREMQAAALTVLVAAHQAGAWESAPARQMGSYEAWERMIRRSVMWLVEQGLTPCEMADPLETQTRERAQDEESATLGALLSAWHALVEDAPISAGALLDEATKDMFNQDAAETVLRIAREVAGTGAQVNMRRWGRYLARHKGRVADGYRLSQPSTVGGQRHWKVALVA